jgi:hypothetical protein
MSLVKGEAPAGSVTTPASDGKPQKIMGSKSDKKAPRKGAASLPPPPPRPPPALF